MKNKPKIYYLFFLFIMLSCTNNNKQPKDNPQNNIGSLEKTKNIPDSITTKRDFSHIDTMTVSPEFVEKLPIINAEKWLIKKQFKGNFSVDSAMHLIFEKNYFHLHFDAYGNESDTEILDVAMWKSQNFKLKTFFNSWNDYYDSFPNTRSKINETRANGDTIFELNGKNYAIISTSTLTCEFPDFMRTGRFQKAFLGIALFEQKKQESNNTKNFTQNDIWEFQFYNPAIGTYGSYSTAPKPKIYQIGKNQLGIIVTSANGGAGGPFYGDLFIHLLDKKSPLLFSEDFISRSCYDEKSSWGTVIKFENTNNQEFADLVLITEGHFLKASFTEIDEDINQMNFPKILQEKVKIADDFDFKLQRTYIYKNKQYALKNEIFIK